MVSAGYLFKMKHIWSHRIIILQNWISTVLRFYLFLVHTVHVEKTQQSEVELQSQTNADLQVVSYSDESSSATKLSGDYPFQKHLSRMVD